MVANYHASRLEGWTLVGQEPYSDEWLLWAESRLSMLKRALGSCRLLAAVTLALDASAVYAMTYAEGTFADAVSLTVILSTLALFVLGLRALPLKIERDVLKKQRRCGSCLLYRPNNRQAVENWIGDLDGNQVLGEDGLMRFAE